MERTRRAAIAIALAVAALLPISAATTAAGSSRPRRPHPTVSYTLPPPPTCAPAVGQVTLDPGLRVSDSTVGVLQAQLKTLGADLGPAGVDTVFGPATVTALASVPLTGIEITDPMFDSACIPMVGTQLGVDLVAAIDGVVGVQDQLTAAVKARSTVASSGSRPSSSGGSCGSDFACFKACTLNIESGGNYGAISSGGTYRGAWQFDQRTWDSNAAASGHPELVGVDPATASEGSQDAVAQATYDARGNQPWGGRC